MGAADGGRLGKRRGDQESGRGLREQQGVMGEERESEEWRGV